MTTPPADRPSEGLIKRAKDALYWLRNGGEDDPYVCARSPVIDGDDDDGSTRINVADDCHFCTVPANEGQPMIGNALAIAGAGKLIADLLAAYKAALSRAPSAEQAAVGAPSEVWLVMVEELDLDGRTESHPVSAHQSMADADAAKAKYEADYAKRIEAKKARGTTRYRFETYSVVLMEVAALSAGSARKGKTP